MNRYSKSTLSFDGSSIATIAASRIYTTGDSADCANRGAKTLRLKVSKRAIKSIAFRCTTDALNGSPFLGVRFFDTRTVF